MLLALSLVLGASSLAAQGEQPPAGKRAKGQTYLGQIDGAPEFSQLAVVIDGKNVLAYVCGADDKFNQQHSRWFRGACSESGEVAATSADGPKLAGKREGETLKVTLTGEDSTLKATLSLQPPGTEVGLWRGEGKLKDYDYVVGYIIKNGKGPAQSRFTGRLALSRKGNSRSIQGLTLGKKNCQLKKANQLQINGQGVVDGAEEEIDVEAEQVDAVAADEEQPEPAPKKKKAPKAVEAAKNQKQA
jgi:hypothetical protein